MHVCLNTCSVLTRILIGCHVATKPVFRASNLSRIKPVSSATETRWKSEISLVASLDMILSNKRITKAMIDCAYAQVGLRLYCSKTTEDRFSRVETQMVRILIGCLHQNCFSKKIGCVHMCTYYINYGKLNK